MVSLEQQFVQALTGCYQTVRDKAVEAKMSCKLLYISKHCANVQETDFSQHLSNM